MARYGITEDYDYNVEHKRKRLHVWSGPFFHTFEAEAYTLPKGDGYMVTTYNGDKIRVACPAPRDDRNYEEVDKAISEALNRHHEEAGRVKLAQD
jgi:hypothetical protein